MTQEQLASVWPDWTIELPEIGHGAYGKVYKIKRSLAGFGEVEYQALKVVSIPLDEDDIDVLMLGQSERETKNAYYRSMAEKMAKEGSILSDLEGNPYIVRYYEHAVIPHPDDQIGWDVLIRMELLTPFRKHMAEHGFTRQDVIRLGIDICKALELCRKKDVVHRDIKPENIFISDVGNYKLGDFGVAINADKTLGGLSKKGTYSYMAPEVYKGQPYGPTIDIYSLGIIMYRLLNKGKEPFMPPKGVGETYEDHELALTKRMQCEPIPYPENESGQLAKIVMKAASPYPEDRYSDPTEMRKALEKLVDANDGELMILPTKGGDPLSTVKKTPPSVSVSTPPTNSDEDVIPDLTESSVAPPKSQNKIWMLCIAFAAVAIGLFALITFRPSPDVEAMEIYGAEATLMVGESMSMDVTFIPKKSSDDLVWSTANETIATINARGKLTAHTAGTAVVTAQTAEGITATCTIRIVSNKPTVYQNVDYGLIYDFNFYTATYPYVKEQYGNNPEGALEHFVTVGIPSGEQGIADFNVLGYANFYPDLRAKYGNDLLKIAEHYIKHGYNENRNGVGSGKMHGYATVKDGVDYSVVYDYNYYVSKYEYVFAMYGVDDAAVLEHFLTKGMVKGEQACEAFDPISYGYQYPDVRERCRISTDGYTFEHYVSVGSFDYTPYYFDYINHGITAGYQGTGCEEMQNYITVYQGVDYSSVYDYNAYCRKNNDIFVICGVDDLAVLEHYVTSGQYEGRSARD